MFIVLLTTNKGAESFGPFRSELAARDWVLEWKELGAAPEGKILVAPLKEPVDLGFDPGL